MRTLVRAATLAVLCIIFSAGGSLADGWADSTAYRGNGWSGAGESRASRSAPERREAAAPKRAARVAAATPTDEDRPQRRSRAAKTDSGSVGRGSVASGDSGGGSSGVASYYWQPQRVAAGGWFNPNAMTAAHKTLPFGTRVRVTHAGNGRSVDVMINDRGPYIAGRTIDLSRAAAQAINMTGQGVASIRMRVLGR